MLFFVGPSPKKCSENSLPRDEINSVKKWDKFSLFQFSRSGPHFSPRTTWPETNDNGEILRQRNKANFYPSFTKRSTKKYQFITAVEYLRCDIVIDLCEVRFKRRILHALNILQIFTFPIKYKFNFIDFALHFVLRKEKRFRTRFISSCLQSRGLLVFSKLSRASRHVKQISLVRCWREKGTTLYTIILNSRYTPFVLCS